MGLEDGPGEGRVKGLAGRRMYDLSGLTADGQTEGGMGARAQVEHCRDTRWAMNVVAGRIERSIVDV